MHGPIFALYSRSSSAIRRTRWRPNRDGASWVPFARAAGRPFPALSLHLLYIAGSTYKRSGRIDQLRVGEPGSEAEKSREK